MSKCVRVVGQGVPVRMSDADANAFVHVLGDGEFCPKHVWKEFYATPYWLERGGQSAGYQTLTDLDRKFLRDRRRAA